jgi:hypothetical protein
MFAWIDTFDPICEGLREMSYVSLKIHESKIEPAFNSNMGLNYNGGGLTPNKLVSIEKMKTEPEYYIVVMETDHGGPFVFNEWKKNYAPRA